MTLEKMKIQNQELDRIYDSWFLTSTPFPVLLSLGLYLLFVLKIGPTFMKNREPYKLKGFIMAYNLFQIVFNGYLCAWLLTDTEGQQYLIKHTCHPLDYNKNPQRIKIYQLGWLYLLLKIIDLTDTVFMVLKKKFSHITFLHLYHHSAMVFFSWFSVKYITEAEQGIIPASINAFVHVIMYTYYFLAAFGPEVQKYLWWKRYLTKIQIAQFFVVIGLWGYLYFNDCKVSQAYNVIWITNVSIILVLFANFYVQTYIIKPKTRGPSGKPVKEE